MRTRPSEFSGSEKLSGRARRLLPWLIAGAWLLGTVIAFRFFDLRLPQALWCIS